MTYARSRLWLGISGVGLLVTASTIALILDLPSRLTSQRQSFGSAELLQLVTLAVVYVISLFPLDFLGGYWFPRKFHKSEKSFAKWFRTYFLSAIAQATLFLAFAFSILLLSQNLGTAGGVLAICLGLFVCLQIRNWSGRLRSDFESSNSSNLKQAVAIVRGWGIEVPKLTVIKHDDVGFTGGIIGIGKNVRVLIPKSWLGFSSQQLATVLARRALAIKSGSYRRGLLAAILWNAIGFTLCSLIPGAGLTSVAGLATTVCAFTIWSFIGLLILPSWSRNASLGIDQQLLENGVSQELIRDAASQIDQMQDDEPDRPALIEAIFHPIPNVASRSQAVNQRGFAAWNLARTTLFFSWPFLGILSRSVHCNVGRPELWVILPSE